jgi:AcrR family transcriptional regulator
MAVDSLNRRQLKQQRTRALLLDGAARVFARRGYHVATLEEVAAEVGLTKGAVYSNFESKEGLFLALVDSEIGKRVREIRSVIGAGATPETVEREAERQFQRFVRDEPHWPLLFYEFFSYGARNAQLRDEFVKRRRAVFEVIAEALARRAAELGFTLPRPAEQIAVAVEALMNGLAFMRVIDPDSVPDGLFGAAMSRLVFSLLTPGPNDGGADDASNTPGRRS